MKTTVISLWNKRLNKLFLKVWDIQGCAVSTTCTNRINDGETIQSISVFVHDNDSSVIGNFEFSTYHTEKYNREQFNLCKTLINKLYEQNITSEESC